MPGRSLRMVGLFVLCATAGAASGESDVFFAAAAPEHAPGTLLSGERVRATFFASGGTMIAGFAGLEGMWCTFAVRAVQKSRVRPRLSLTDPAGAAFDL